MTSSQLASRLRITRQAVVDLERRERTGGVTITALEKAADAMNCHVLYAIVPKEPIEKMLKDRARAIAARRLGTVAHSMELEDQGVPSEEYWKQVDDMAAHLLRGPSRNLWKDS